MNNVRLVTADQRPKADARIFTPAINVSRASAAYVKR
ncbi:hypothetical protein FHR83_007973 [Actinoplanes campanulatus]|uniref:Uncharacterized protein n=1 Tax=Actinoplanes campanulatus TaxID=113559 RepID=A0A7W5AQ28_9ACTN|nr:hypothetical protein [Actinoplanes campanulatus]